MGFFDEIGKALGIAIGKSKRGGVKKYRFDQSMRTITGKSDKLFDKYEEELTHVVDKKTGKTLAKVLHDANHPNWTYIKNILPKDVLERIKEKSGIED